jgi:hypothetical protein
MPAQLPHQRDAVLNQAYRGLRSDTLALQGERVRSRSQEKNPAAVVALDQHNQDAFAPPAKNTFRKKSSRMASSRRRRCHLETRLS